MPNIQQPSQCPSCLNNMGPRFCANCGEKKLDAKTRSIKHIIGDYIEDVTSFDNKIWRTLKLLMLHPGNYEFKYHIGQRINFLKPISLFLIMNFLFVLFSPISDFNVTLIDQLKLQPYSQWIQPIHENQQLPESGLSPKNYAAQYNQSVKILSRSTIIIQALLFFLFVLVANHQKGYFPGDHLVYALNLHSWYMAWIVFLMAFIKVLVWLSSLIGLGMSYGFWYFRLLPIGLALYILISVYTLYRRNWWQTLFQGTLLFLALKVCHIIYRLIQYFLVTSLI